MDLFLESFGSEGEESAWHANGSLFGNREDSGRKEDVPGSGPGRDTADPALGARVGDDDMGPGHLKTAEGDAGEDDDEGAGNRVVVDGGAN